MRHKRAKVYKRAIAIYTSAFGFRTPFQILVSNDVILATNRESDLWKQLAACVQGEIKPMITQCCVQALYALGKEHQHETEIAKSFERRKCNHRTAIDPNECLKDVIGPTNKHRYVLATQAKVLRLSLSAIPGLPIIHFNPRGVLVLSPPSHATLKHKDAIEAERLLATDPVVDVVDGSNVIGAEPLPSGSGPGKSLAGRNRVKGPNPLSVKKKKAPADKGKGKRARDEGEEIDGQVDEPVVAAEAAVADGKKRKRRRKKGIVAEAIEEIERDFEAKAAAGGDGDSD